MNVRDFGARGDGVTYDRPAFQTALAAGTDLYVPNGRYLLDNGSDTFALRLLDNVSIRGESRENTVLIQAPGTPGSVRLLQVDGTNVSLNGFSLDGQWADQLDTDEHRHGVFVSGSSATLSKVDARFFTGDGFYFYKGSDGFHVVDCEAASNDRNGLTLGYGMDSGEVHGSRFFGNLAQQFDSEPGGGVITNLTIADCAISGSPSGQHVLTVSGSSETAMSSGWRITGCTIEGGIHVVWCRDILIADCKGGNSTPQPSVSIYRTNRNIMVADCDFWCTGRADGADAPLTVKGTAEGGASGVVVRRSRLSGSKYGVLCEGAVGVELYDNDIKAENVGFYARATSPTRTFDLALAQRNRISAAIGVQLAGNGSAILAKAVITHNSFDVTAGGMQLDDGTGCAKSIIEGSNELVGLSTVMRL